MKQLTVSATIKPTRQVSFVMLKKVSNVTTDVRKDIAKITRFGSSAIVLVRVLMSSNKGYRTKTEQYFQYNDNDGIIHILSLRRQRIFQGQLLEGVECHIYLYCFTFDDINLNRALVIIVLFPTKYSNKKVCANDIRKRKAL